MMKLVIWTFCPIHGAVAVPEQPRRFFALSDVTSHEEYHLIMIIHKHPVILLSTFPDSDDEVHCHKLVHGSDHQLALHAGLCCHVLIAVPADVQRCTVALAYKKVAS